MDSLGSLFKTLSAGRNVQKQWSQLENELRTHPDVREFAEKNPDIDEAAWSRNASRLFQFVTERKACAHCPGLDHCPNMMKGYRPQLVNDKGTPSLTFVRCPLLEEQEVKQRQSNLIHSYYVPKDVLNATFDSIDKEEGGRQEAILAAGEFVKRYLNNPSETKGLYLCGEFGVGKTYLMGAIMKRLAERRHIASLIVYVPDFFREIKGAIQNHSVDEKLEVLKKTPVLILDDIGAETITPWVRDEVLGSILQYRMMDHLPTLYTSNFTYDELEDHFSYSQKSGIEHVKAKRLMERIRHFTQLVEMTGVNRR
ncbi:primosomal protein DnaI [Sporolactobacillus terrae]|uniref:Primosomal protein DnaI n=1 Tax=Sporolactobacillus terrae TaxID=269673 RepID=A0ABX5Q8N5_9BACL|nr:primosomal protein DnaI [Sporolactobacillus terrae]QAA22996.1 primosomal protein DnaI [Sporolactobacillus terrae]QAA25969.1 primosomal protein DnaI [Sporolactobacillus terrae]UAK15066.1 primosomal protein DnaI [Sporolactobacillus terrae]